jgi:hypothetical protein
VTRIVFLQRWSYGLERQINRRLGFEVIVDAEGLRQRQRLFKTVTIPWDQVHLVYGAVVDLFTYDEITIIVEDDSGHSMVVRETDPCFSVFESLLNARLPHAKRGWRELLDVSVPQNGSMIILDRRT